MKQTTYAADVLRIMAEMHTFTTVDLSDALEVSDSRSQQITAAMVKRGKLAEIRIGRANLYALTEKGQICAAKLPPIDVNERLLPLTWEGIIPEHREYCSVCYHALTQSEMDAGDTVCTDCWANELPF